MNICMRRITRRRWLAEEDKKKRSQIYSCRMADFVSCNIKTLIWKITNSPHYVYPCLTAFPNRKKMFVISRPRFWICLFINLACLSRHGHLTTHRHSGKKKPRRETDEARFERTYCLKSCQRAREQLFSHLTHFLSRNCYASWFSARQFDNIIIPGSQLAFFVRHARHEEKLQ